MDFICHLLTNYMYNFETKLIESVAKVKSIIHLGNLNVDFKYSCKFFARNLGKHYLNRYAIYPTCRI